MTSDLEIPGYTLEKRLGAGGMAQVYLALQHSLNRKVALKLMTLGDPELRERFIHEGRMVARLNHHHIITIYDVGEFPGGGYMAMEYADGGGLDQRIKHGLTTAQSLTFLRQIASALDHAHQQGLVHRDIKPANILFMANGDAKVADFGIAKDSLQDQHLTQTGSVLGTPIYMSPEQALGEQATSRSDLYSLGVMFYEMLTGSRPYQARDSHALLAMHIHQPIPRLPSALARYQDLVERLMAKRPEQRFATAAELLVTLSQIQEVPAEQTGGEVMMNDGEWRVRVQPDPEQRPGYAALVIEGLALPPHEVQYSIRRSGFGNDDLGPEGWRNGEHWFAPLRIDTLSAQESRLLVGPEIARHLENGNYQLGLQAPGFSKPQQRVMQWRDIPQPAVVKRRRGGMAGTVPAAPSPAEDLTLVGSEPTSSTLPPVIQPAPPVVIEPKPPLLHQTDEHKRRPSSSKMWLILATVGALAVLGVGGYWWSLPAPAPPVVDKPGKTPPPTVMPPVVTPSAFSVQDARQKLQAGLTPDQMYALAQQFQTQPDGLQGAFLLYGQAAEQGHAAAALKLGEMYDPASSQPTPLPRRRAAKAYAWYRQATAGGVAEASQHLDALRAWAEQAAARGDADAQTLLQDWQN
ncbi:MAG TPA: protein kinase [Candidatus Competibacteraceae bacterium]|nr:protein kinase [Candidatus Competibacteraceae bacterium]HRZ05431.1 protein kinase [Candidatus Competibacteraceae bacterium]HSA44908.1 protein kinase [Candidatus Competibacteraceae bacterium]